MTLEDLKVWIGKNRINPIYMSIGSGLPDAFEQMCIVKEGNTWEVYFAERGQKRNLRTFNSEDAACKYFISEIRSSRTLRLK